MLTMRCTIFMLLLATSTPILCSCRSLRERRAEPDRTSIEAQYSKVDLSRGVSREDAVVIAQHYMLSKGYDYDWFVAAPEKVTEDAAQNAWTVSFEPKEDGHGSGPRRRSEVTFQMLLPFSVTIRKDTGDVSVLVVRTNSK